MTCANSYIQILEADITRYQKHCLYFVSHQSNESLQLPVQLSVNSYQELKELNEFLESEDKKTSLVSHFHFMTKLPMDGVGLIPFYSLI